MASITGTIQNPPEVGSDEHTALLEKAKSLNIHRYEPKVKLGPYDDQVQTLLAVDEATGYENSIEVLVPTAEVVKHKRWFTKSAEVYGKGARVVNGDKGVEQSGGGTLLEFILTEKITRKPKSTVPATDEDTPVPA